MLHEQAIGEVLSVHFEWLLDVRHGADYFRRWHREKAQQRRADGAQGQPPLRPGELVAGQRAAGGVRLRAARLLRGRRGARHGLRREYVRAYDSPEAAEDPFALDISGHEGLRELYLCAEADSGYVRDRNVFDGDISIEDDMAVLVRYASGASMSYHLTAYSPWEGYRVMFNGSAGRLELEVTESAWQPPRNGAESPGGAIHGEVAMANAGGATIRLRRLWERPSEVPGRRRPRRPRRRRRADADRAVRPGGFRVAARRQARPEAEPGDAARQCASQHDGALALAGRRRRQRMLPYRPAGADR